MIVYGRRGKNQHHFPGEECLCVHLHKLTLVTTVVQSPHMHSFKNIKLNTQAIFQQPLFQQIAYPWIIFFLSKKWLIIVLYIMLVSHRHFPLLDLLWTHNTKDINEKLHRRQIKFIWDSHVFISTSRGQNTQQEHFPGFDTRTKEGTT